MIITKQKTIEELKKFMKGEKSVFIIGCGECAATCKTGGEPEIQDMKARLEKEGFTVTGTVIPDAPCMAPQVKVAFAKNKKLIDQADSILVMACGLGAQSVKDNLVLPKEVHIGCDTTFMGQVMKNGSFFESCSACGECVLEITDMICPVTKCPKSIMNGPCGGQDKGKCEVDRDMDCVWITIYEALKKKKKLRLFTEINPPKPNAKAGKPRKSVI